LVTIVVVSVIGASLTRFYTSQLDFQRTEDAMRDSRSSARAALNVLRSDMRMIDSGGGVVSAAPDDITLRVPYSFGVACASAVAATVASLLPSDATAYANAGYSGWAWRNGTTGQWVYEESVVTLSDPGTAVCDAASVAVLPGGRTLAIVPGLPGVAVGDPVMLFQQIRYRFDDSNLLPGRRALFRTVVSTNQDSELVAPFSNTARFRFYTDWDTAQDAAPADLSTIVGFEISLDTESMADSPRRGQPEPFSLTTSIFFKNVSG
jgi:hypothetical protein